MPGFRVYYCTPKLKAFHLVFGSRRATVFALAGMKIVNNIQRNASSVVALTFVNPHTVGVHSPVNIGCNTRRIYIPDL